MAERGYSMDYIYVTTIDGAQFKSKNSFADKETATVAANEFHAKHPELPIVIVGVDENGNHASEEVLYNTQERDG